jgi:hypothetical protein
MVERVAHGDRQSPARPQHAYHFPKGSVPVLEEHEAELAGHRIETFVWEWQRLGPSIPPLDA